MDANRYFTAMHNAMSSVCRGRRLLAAVRLQDLCGNDAYLEVRRMPGEHCATVCYSTMGRRGLNFQLFRKEGGCSATTRAASSPGSSPPRPRACWRTPTSTPAAARTGWTLPAPTAWCRSWKRWRARTAICLCPVTPAPGPSSRWTALWAGAHWSYSTLSKAPCLPVAAILYWLADSLAGAERRTLQADPEARPAGRTVAERHGGDVLPPGRTGCRPAADAAPDPAGEPSGPPGPHLRPHQKLAEHSGRDGEHEKAPPCGRAFLG